MKVVLILLLLCISLVIHSQDGRKVPPNTPVSFPVKGYWQTIHSEIKQRHSIDSLLHEVNHRDSSISKQFKIIESYEESIDVCQEARRKEDSVYHFHVNQLRSQYKNDLIACTSDIKKLEDKLDKKNKLIKYFKYVGVNVALGIIVLILVVR